MMRAFFIVGLFLLLSINSNDAASCTEEQAIAYIQNACDIDIRKPCSESQSMVDCGVREVRSKCGEDMVNTICGDLPAFLSQIHSTCTGLTCSATSIYVSSSIVVFMLFKIFLEKFFLCF
uniref:Uncharacterized protein n=1 Tax=Panagrolaimus sp. ES5 TaxID=591445 RepID=A0AC34FRP6_9BILA